MVITCWEDNREMIEFENQVKEAELLHPVNAAVWLETEPPAPDQIIENALDVRDKLAIIGSPKMRKSFFLLQFLICLAAGRPSPPAVWPDGRAT